MDKSTSGHSLFRVVLALVFICFGLIALGNNLNWWNIDDLFLNWWPLIVILIGLITIFAPGGSWGGGIVLIFLGVVFLLHTHGIYDLEDLVWPGVLIMLGIIILPRKRKAPRHYHSGTEGSNNTDPKRERVFHATNADHVFTINTIFNSQREVIKDDQLAGGHGTAAFGNLELDLRQSAPTLNTYLEFSAIFGNITLFVPKDWKIIKYGGPVFGKVNDHRNQASDSQNPKTVSIEMNAIFGSIDIMN